LLYDDHPTLIQQDDVIEINDHPKPEAPQESYNWSLKLSECPRCRGQAKAKTGKLEHFPFPYKLKELVEITMDGDCQIRVF
jgi:hypothetical protein